jgi:hypothetical protein
MRAELVQVAARPARRGRDTITWHLPDNWPWQHAWLGPFDATHRAGRDTGRSRMPERRNLPTKINVGHDRH